jgi:uncharacterized membrane protein
MKAMSTLAPAVIIGAGYVAGVIMYPEIPSLSTHVPWPPALTRPLIAFTLPTAATVTYLILRTLWGEASDAATAHRAIAACVVFFVVAVHALVLLNLAGVPWIRESGPRLVIALFGGFLIATGNLLPRTRPNLAFGIRTQRTLGDRQVWIRVHRTAGYVAVALGFVIVLSGLYLNDPALGLIVSAAALGSLAILGVSYRRQSSG